MLHIHRLRHRQIKELEAFELWIWRRMEKISWKDKKTIMRKFYRWFKKIERFYGIVSTSGWVTSLTCYSILFRRKEAIGKRIIEEEDA